MEAVNGRSSGSSSPVPGSSTAEGVHRFVDHGAREAPVREEAVRAHAEDPHRIAQLDLESRQLLAVAVQVPPTVSVGHPVQRAVGAPLRLHDRLIGAAGDEVVLDPELAPQERQQRVVPREVREAAVGPDSRSSVEVAARSDDVRLPRSVCGKRDELVHDVAGSMRLAYADHLRAVRRDAAVRIAQRVGLGRFGCYRAWIASAVDAVDAAVAEVREEERVAMPPCGAAAVLVDARARVEAGRRQLDSRAVGLSLDEHRAAAFGRARLDPEDAVVVEIDDDPAEPRVARARRTLDRDRRRPRSVRCNLLRHRRITNGSEHVRHERLRAEGVPDAEDEADEAERRREPRERSAHARDATA